MSKRCGGTNSASNAFLFGNQNGVKVGAIRWDAWYDTSTISPQMEASLGPNEYHWRAPWFSVPGNNTISIKGRPSQSTMDQEIQWAAYCGLSYWAFVRYDPFDAPMNNGWNLYEASAYKDLIPWCMINSFNGFSVELNLDTAAFVSLINQSHYFKYGTRPIIFILDDGNSSLATTAITTLRSASSSAGKPDPYVVVMVSGGTTARACDALRATVGGNAISSYVYELPGNYSSYKELDISVRKFWKTQSIYECIPIGVLGWNRTPRIIHPVSWEGWQSPGVGLSFVYQYPSDTDELADHVQALINFTNANVASKLSLIYAWNEHDEGGWMCPTLTNSGPDTSRIEALKKVLSAQVSYTYSSRNKII